MAETACEGFSWIGQTFASCDTCGHPYWVHSHDRKHKPGAGPLDADDEVLVPITPTQAAACKRRWCPTCSGPIRETVGMVCQTCGTDYGTPLRRVGDGMAETRKLLPHELWQQAHDQFPSDDAARRIRYIALMREHGHLVPTIDGLPRRKLFGCEGEVPR